MVANGKTKLQQQGEFLNNCYMIKLVHNSDHYGAVVRIFLLRVVRFLYLHYITLPYMANTPGV